jgi:hypothetical protein
VPTVAVVVPEAVVVVSEPPHAAAAKGRLTARPNATMARGEAARV